MGFGEAWLFWWKGEVGSGEEFCFVPTLTQSQCRPRGNLLLKTWPPRGLGAGPDADVRSPRLGRPRLAFTQSLARADGAWCPEQLSARWRQALSAAVHEAVTALAAGLVSSLRTRLGRLAYELTLGLPAS